MAMVGVAEQPAAAMMAARLRRRHARQRHPDQQSRDRPCHLPEVPRAAGPPAADTPL